MVLLGLDKARQVCKSADGWLAASGFLYSLLLFIQHDVNNLMTP